MKPEIGKSYIVPSGMGGVFTVMVTATHATGVILHGPGGARTVPAIVCLRVDMPLNRDWHGHTYDMPREIFDAQARAA